MLTADMKTGRLLDQTTGTLFTSHPCRYVLEGMVDGAKHRDNALTDRVVSVENGDIVVTGLFPFLQIELRQTLRMVDDGIQETISLTNHLTVPVQLTDIGIGFVTDLTKRIGWKLTAIPFAVQLDGSRHDYTSEELMAGQFKNVVYRDRSRAEPPLIEADRLRSEAWAWRCNDINLLVMKYNPSDIELSVAAVIKEEGATHLRLGGVGTCLYTEPVRLHRMEPGQTVTAGMSIYRVIRGAVGEVFTAYRDELDRRGHGLPPDYNPPVNWNELYDIGWHHSDRRALARRYTREALEQQAALARDIGCELLYLDPGWEIAEGLTRWDEDRLGSLAEFRVLLRQRYGLELGLRTILRCNGEAAMHDWNKKHMVQHANITRVIWFHWLPDLPVKEYCLCDAEFWQQKLDRINTIIQQGVTFLMVDEMDWRGPCYSKTHGHAVPSTQDDHARAVYALCRELRRRNPSLLIECHDPIWPWHSCIYVPTYFEQGFQNGAYQENWGFEYMWNCIDDLKTGKALALYYYALSCNIPLYLHITMAADNEACVFFWWAASTVRHLGIGGKTGDPTINPKDKPPHDPEKRYVSYKEQMTRYKRLKPWFVRGVFHGIAENIHLHTLPGHDGGVLNLFNLTDESRQVEANIPLRLLGTTQPLPVDSGVEVEWSPQHVTIRTQIPPMSPAVIGIGIPP